VLLATHPPSSAVVMEE